MEQTPYERLCIEAWNILQDYQGDYIAAAGAAGVKIRTFRDRVANAKLPVTTEPRNESTEAVQPVSKPRIRVRAVTHETPPEGPIYRVVAIGDFHDSPSLSKDRFRWVGRHITDKRPDRVVQIGDWGTFDSMSMHDAPGSRNSIARPSFVQDLESLNESLEAFHQDLGLGSVPCDITFGNHEHRCQKAADNDPVRLGDAMLRVEEVFARYRWNYRPYGEYLFIGGAGFVHTPRTIMGKEYGGKRVENQVGNDALFSIIWGHSHRRGFWSFPKIGPQQGIDLCNLGSAMPQGYVANYAKLSTTGWSYGIYDLTIQGGRILSDQFTSMAELQVKYAD
jgi:hypothetical protein